MIDTTKINSTNRHDCGRAGPRWLTAPAHQSEEIMHLKHLCDRSRSAEPVGRLNPPPITPHSKVRSMPRFIGNHDEITNPKIERNESA
jgi:hypothetical protein